MTYKSQNSFYQQEILAMKEEMDEQLLQMEQMIEIAAKAMQKLILWKAQKKEQSQKQNEHEVEFVNPFAVEEGNEMNLVKLRFPKLGPGVDLKEWIQDCESYFEIYEIPEHRKVSCESHSAAHGWGE